MCCQAEVTGNWSRGELEAIFEIAGFEPTSFSYRFIREFESMLSPTHLTWEDKSPVIYQRRVVADISSDHLHFTLNPSIASHTEEQHAVSALGATILYKTAMTFAERSGGKITQMLLRGACLPANGDVQNKIVADYAHGLPLRFENLCVGFQHALEHGIGDATRGAYDGEQH